MWVRHMLFKQNRELISFRAFGNGGIWGLTNFQDGSVLTSAVEAWILQ